MTRILWKLNVAAGALVVVAALLALCAVGWWVWRPTPQTSGNIQAPLGAEVTIVRDSLGVPHIRAASLEDALFAQGFATAQDRLWQMDSLRRLAAGELSEVAGRAALPLDTKARQFRMRRVANEWVRRMPARDKAGLAAFARGVNFYIETHRGNYPPEFTAMSYDPKPWTIADTLLCALQMNRTLSGHYESDIQKARMLATGDKARVEYLFPTRAGDEPQPGSNSWVVSGDRTATGKPLLANDPHLEWTMPATWHMIHIQAPGYHVTGATLPGVPGVIIGHNEHIAWGITALQFDNQDLYAEDLDLRSGRYRFQGEERLAQRESEWIAIHGEKPIQVMQLVTVHGPVISSEGGKPLALKWGAAVSELYDFPILDLNRATDWQQFRDALSRLRGPNINVTYADVDGNTGWQLVGQLPLREGFDGSVPLDGASGQQEWKGFIPFEQLPAYYNPKSGILATANQNGFPEKTPFQVSGFFASPHRAKQIVDRLSSKPKWTAEEMLRLQTDVYSAFHKFLADQAVSAVERREEKNSMAREAAALLKSWNGQMDASRPEPFLATLLYQHLRRAVSERACPKDGNEVRTFMVPGALTRLIRERPSGWFDNYDLLLANELADAMEEAKRIQGRNPARWQYGRLNELTISHPIASRIKWIAPYFNIGPVPVSGSGTSINAATPRLGPSMRFIADVADWDKSMMNLPTGESGHIFSGHYKDQWEAFAAGRSYPMPFAKVPEGKTLVLRP